MLSFGAPGELALAVACWFWFFVVIWRGLGLELGNVSGVVRSV